MLSPHTNSGRGSPQSNTTQCLTFHLLAEVTGTAGREGQRADIGMAGIKGGPQQCFTPLIHTLGGAEAKSWGCGAGSNMHSFLTSPAPQGTPTWAGRREVEKKRGAMGTSCSRPLLPIAFKNWTESQLQPGS
jgi:hypothetical protein